MPLSLHSHVDTGYPGTPNKTGRQYDRTAGILVVLRVANGVQTVTKRDLRDKKGSFVDRAARRLEPHVSGTWAWFLATY